MKDDILGIISMIAMMIAVILLLFFLLIASCFNKIENKVMEVKNVQVYRNI